MTAAAEAVPLSARCICGDVRLDHKMGKGPCKVCGCDQFEVLDGAPVEAAEPALTAVPAPPARLPHPAPPEPTGDPIATLLNRALATEVPSIVRAADKIQDLIDQLEDKVAAHEQGAKLRAEAEELEKRLAAIRQQLGVKQSAKSVDSKAIRAWAAQNGIDCAPLGRVPAAVVEAYRKATAT